ncbi:N-acetylmuramoyl-L-alanine amidase [Clostridium sp. YIM B02505]|uniref:N-acetylmuramoyl-L-alanine amidase n=1 Tax=Clostridium yunnanense TaxID=2800325 RepID=A0ABS1EMK7_9CLOT|nr:N-acetylmuramoyl-L-alanine amidase [Clostridium yunnanense]MBK1810590.1 N-acetylmuramoyl-L-alanine amidase [Clostridium yunnanense]
MKKKRKRYKIRIERLAFSVSVISMLILLVLNGAISIFTSNKDKIDDTTLLVKSKQNFIVCIDPGHGAYDRGAESANGVFEKDVVLKVGLKVGQILENNNIKVVYTRKDDKTILGSDDREDLKKRVQISHDNKADLFVSIHCNSYKDTSIKGIELWCNEPNTKAELLAKDIQEELYKLKYTEKRNIKYQSNSLLYVLKNNDAISALVEIGYLSNKEDSKFITSKDGQAKCAEAIAKAILTFKDNIKK